jgi:hypothetical protein
MAYERVLLDGADKRTNDRLVKAAQRMLPLFVDHTLWRPKERAFIGRAMHERDVARLKAEIEDGVRLAASLGIDVGEIHVPV